MITVKELIKRLQRVPVYALVMTKQGHNISEPVAVGGDVSIEGDTSCMMTAGTLINLLRPFHPMTKIRNLSSTRWDCEQQAIKLYMRSNQ